jgi:hypothetical protein
MADGSDGDSAAKLWAWLGGIASLVAILTWLGVTNAHDLKGLLVDSSPPTSSPTPYKPSPTVPSPPDSGTGGSDSGGGDSGDEDSGDGENGDPGSDAASSGGSDESGAGISSPTPDPTEESFKAVSVGDCLKVYDTGLGGTSIDWSADVPPAPVPCNSQAAGLVQVTSTTDTTCPSGAGQASWTYASSVSGDTTRLCVTRIYQKYYCVLGKRVGEKTQLGSMTAVDCKAPRIPSAYNRIIHITGVYQAPTDAGPRNCAQGAYDRTQYLAWLVNDNKTLLCATVYTGG